MADLGNVSMAVLRALLTKKAWHAFSHMVTVETFDSNEFRRLYQHVERMHGETEADLTIQALRADVEIQYVRKPDLIAELTMVIDRLEATGEMDHDLLQSLVRRFLQRSASYTLAEYVSNHVDKAEFSVATVKDLADRAVEVGERVSQAITDVFTSPLSGALDNRRVANSLGVSRQLDSGLGGGVSAGELFIYLAPPSRGKTSLLCRTGATHAAAGGRVLHVTLEISTRKVIERYDQCWTGKSREELQTVEGQEAIRQAREIVRGSGGHVWVVDWSYLTVSAGDIGSLVRRMKGMRCQCCDLPMKVDLIVVDYLELMHPNKLPGKEMRQIFSAIGKEHRALACNLEVPICTAWQVNRAGSEETLLSERHVSESWDVIKIADIIIGLNQSREQLGNRRLVANIIKQRESTNRSVYELYCDLDRMVIRDCTVQDTRDLVNATLPQPQVSSTARDVSP